MAPLNAHRHRRHDDAIIPSMPWLSRLHDDEEGMVTWAFLVAILFFLVLGGFVFNAGNTINRKIETQNAADAATYSGTVWVARGMNSVTATNHLIGELNALYILHHSLGGKWLDENDRSESGNNTWEVQLSNIALDVAYNLASPSSPVPVVRAQYDKVKQNPSADINSTIYESKLILKHWMAGAYGAHFIGYLLSQSVFPPTVAAGIAIEAGALVTETAVWKEYLVLDGLEIVAYSLRNVKQTLPTVISITNRFQQAYRLGVPILAMAAASQIADKHGATGAVYGDLPDALPKSFGDVLNQGSKFVPTLPVEAETTTYEERSQLMRATYPWVTYWRTPIIKFLRNPLLGAPISRAGDHYMKWTNRYSIQTCVWLRRDSSRSAYVAQLTVVNYGLFGGRSGSGERGKNIRLYVVTGLNDTPRGVGKSQEVWNQWNTKRKATSRLEQLFCHVGFATTPAPVVLPRRFYRQENPQGIVCFAQSMLYNGNPQQRPQVPNGNGQPQATVGFDTLNWTDNACEYPTTSYVDDPPTIVLNWQAKLSPVTPEKILRVIPAAVVTDEHVRKVAIDCGQALFLCNQ